MSGALQIAGAVLVLAAFALLQLRRLQPSSSTYLALNVVGAGALAVVAALEEQWGFLLLESVWAVVAACGARALVLRRRASSRRTGGRRR